MCGLWFVVCGCVVVCGDCGCGCGCVVVIVVIVVVLFFQVGDLWWFFFFKFVVHGLNDSKDTVCFVEKKM